MLRSKFLKFVKMIDWERNSLIMDKLYILNYIRNDYTLNLLAFYLYANGAQYGKLYEFVKWLWKTTKSTYTVHKINLFFLHRVVSICLDVCLYIWKQIFHSWKRVFYRMSHKKKQQQKQQFRFIHRVESRAFEYNWKWYFNILW